MNGHARLSPSNTRWPECPASVRAEEGYPDIPGDAAIDGTGTHLLLEHCLQERVAPETLVGQIIGVGHEDKPTGWLVDAERAARIRVCLDYVGRRADELSQAYPGARITVDSESKSDPGGAFGRTDWYGTCDITISAYIGDRPVFIETVDYKDGQGFVAAENNTQLLSYLFGKMRPWVASGPERVRPFTPETIDAVRMTIVQPKTDIPIRTWIPTVEGVIKEAEKLAWKAHQTDRPDAPFTPGKHCRWCKHKPNCSAQAEIDITKVKAMTETVGELLPKESLFEVLERTFGDITQLEDDKLSELADTKAGLMAVYERVEAEIQRRIEAGIQVPGYGMVPGRGERVWVGTEEEIVKALKSRKFTKEDIYPPKLVSVAQAMKNPKLDEGQRKRLEDKYVTFKAGALKLKQISREKVDAPQEDKIALFRDIPVPEQPSAPAAPKPMSFM